MEAVVGKSNRSNPETTMLEEDVIFDLLGNKRRRACLKEILTREGEIPVSELAEKVAEDIAEKSTPPEDLQRSVYISLCQSHLPKLDGKSIVEYDSESKTVSRGPLFDQIKPYIRTRTSRRQTWLVYTGVSVATVLLLATVIVNTPFVLPYVVQLLLVVHLGVTAFGIVRLLND